VGPCLEHGIGVEKELIEAADYSARSVAFDDPFLVRRRVDEGFVYAGYFEAGNAVELELAVAARSYKRVVNRGCLGAPHGDERC
jgi:hypothetical protein